MGKLNAETREKTGTMQTNNELELYRMAYNSIDQSVANAKFHFDQWLIDLSHESNGKAEHLNDLYTFRLTRKKKAIEYKKTVGHDPDQKHLKNT